MSNKARVSAKFPDLQTIYLGLYFVVDVYPNVKMISSNLPLFIPCRIFKVIPLIGLLLFASCDSSFVPDIGSPEEEGRI